MSDQMQDQETVDIPGLRAAADRGKAAQQEADALRRELAFTKAGVNTDTPIGKLFVKSYDGNLEVDDVKAAWAEVAPAPVADGNTPEPVVTTPTTEQTNETEQRRLLTSGGAGDSPIPTPPEDPVARGYDAFHERMQGGDRRETASAEVFGSLFKGASEGDERVLWNGWTEEELGRR